MAIILNCTKAGSSGSLVFDLTRRVSSVPAPVTSVSSPFTLAQTIINMSTGAATFNSSWYATDFIELPDGVTEISFANETGSTVYFRGAFYDSNQGYLSSGLASVWSIQSSKTSAKTVPSGAKYIRLSTNVSAFYNTTQTLSLTY